MRTKRTSYISLLSRARDAVRHMGRRKGQRRPKMQFLDLELFQVDIRL